MDFKIGDKVKIVLVCGLDDEELEEVLEEMGDHIGKEGKITAAREKEIFYQYQTDTTGDMWFFEDELRKI